MGDNARCGPCGATERSWLRRSRSPWREEDTVTIKVVREWIGLILLKMSWAVKSRRVEGRWKVDQADETAKTDNPAGGDI